MANPLHHLERRLRGSNGALHVDSKVSIEASIIDVINVCVVSPRSIVDDDVYVAERLDRSMNYACRALDTRYVGGVCHCDPAAISNVLYNLLGGTRIVDCGVEPTSISLSDDRAANVVYQDSGTLCCECHSMRPSEPAPSAGYHSDLPVELTHKYPPIQTKGGSKQQ
jgi:hypothetical protein